MDPDQEPIITDVERRAFDALLEQVLADLPDFITGLFEEVALVVEDYPAEDVMEQFDLAAPDQLCGLHDGLPLTERSVEDVTRLPDHVVIYREGIFGTATGPDGLVDPDELYRQIRITLLHEIGHHFGLDEAKLRELGYE